jgi:hypothetical protein
VYVASHGRISFNEFDVQVLAYFPGRADIYYLWFIYDVHSPEYIA